MLFRFGKVLDSVVQPGLHWNPPIIDEVSLVNILALNTETYDARSMLTTDENIIDIAVTVQFPVDDPVNYVIAVASPSGSPATAGSTRNTPSR